MESELEQAINNHNLKTQSIVSRITELESESKDVEKN